MLFHLSDEPRCCKSSLTLFNNALGFWLGFENPFRLTILTGLKFEMGLRLDIYTPTCTYFTSVCLII